MRSLKVALLALVAASPLAAQAYNYPELQTPRIVDREYNFAAASAGNAGTSLLFQWREGLNENWQFSLDGGLASPKGGNTNVLVAGGLAWQWVRSTADMPFDVAVTGGAGLSSGNSINVVRIPIGAAVGHTFKLDNGNELTPFVHPRLSLDFCSGPSITYVNQNSSSTVPVCGSSTTKLDVDVDIGVNYEITQQVAVRVGALLGGTSYFGSTNAIGFSIAWTPKGLKKF
jgi:outer membrane autotransporter protein